jgi:transposase InsO family protein
MPPKATSSTALVWARFRFSVIGPLLSAPPPRGELKAAIESLAEKVWTHPVSGSDVRYSAKTIEGWYHKALQAEDDPIAALRRAVRKDTGQRAVSVQMAEVLQRQHREHPHWTYQLHYDNLASVVKGDPSLGPLCSYSSVKRFMQSRGMIRRRRAPKKRPGEARAMRRRESREVRSFESEYPGSLWHLDFHHGSLKVITDRGQWRRPIALGILDDHSRLCCHLQWYLSETAEDLVHGFSQALQKRGLPRSLMTDNGAAMIAEEFTEGLLSLSIVHEKTLPYSPHQNGKQERLWGTLEGRLMEMLNGAELTLDFLNQATQAWVEMEYNRAVHRELGASPVERFSKTQDVLRSSPTSQALRKAFRLQALRKQRSSDGTISLEGVRFEVPSRYRHFRQVAVRYARWDLAQVDLVDPRDGTVLTPLSPLDRAANADGRRRAFDVDVDPDDDAAPGNGVSNDDGPDKPLPPLLRRILDDYAASGSPPAYLPKSPRKGADS